MDIWYLSDRAQYVKTNGCVSEVVTYSTGDPQGIVLGPFIFIFYTAHFFCYNSNLGHPQKFSNDSASVGCISEKDEREHRRVILEFMNWCEQTQLLVNTDKTK